jgi:SAM-dependent methyltransferase
MVDTSQQEKWNLEYESVHGVVTSTRTNPSGSVSEFLHYLESHEVPLEGQILDLGCGAGRNSIFLAQRSFQVTAIDFSANAIAKLEARASELGVREQITTAVGSIAARMPFDKSTFDFAVDVTTSNSLNLNEFNSLESELSRVLKPDGYFMSYVMADDDEYLGANPDLEGFTVIPESGLRDRAISENLLRSTYANWDILELKKMYKDDLLYGKTYKRALWWMVAKKRKTT